MSAVTFKLMQVRNDTFVRKRCCVGRKEVYRACIQVRARQWRVISRQGQGSRIFINGRACPNRLNDTAYRRN